MIEDLSRWVLKPLEFFCPWGFSSGHQKKCEWDGEFFCVYFSICKPHYVIQSACYETMQRLFLSNVYLVLLGLAAKTAKKIDSQFKFVECFPNVFEKAKLFQCMEEYKLRISWKIFVQENLQCWALVESVLDPRQQFHGKLLRGNELQRIPQ